MIATLAVMLVLALDLSRLWTLPTLGPVSLLPSWVQRRFLELSWKPSLASALPPQEMQGASASDALTQIAKAREKGERIVFTNGADILHAGHVAYLEQARRLGDRLVLGLNNDDSITRLNVHQMRLASGI